MQDLNYKTTVFYCLFDARPQLLNNSFLLFFASSTFLYGRQSELIHSALFTVVK